MKSRVMPLTPGPSPNGRGVTETQVEVEVRDYVQSREPFDFTQDKLRDREILDSSPPLRSGSE